MTSGTTQFAGESLFARHLRTGRDFAGELLSDTAVHTGIKFALAGTIALFFSLLIRLDEPTWAVTTAYVLSTPKFVGAIAEKTVFRIVGALCGAVIGYLITGSLQQTPALFLAAMGGLVALTTAFYGGTFAPYGIRQCGYTATLVAAQGLTDPAFSWHVGLARCEEICLGIVVTMLVTTTVWPRYARKEFSKDVRGTLAVLGRLFRQRAARFLSGESSDPPDVLGTIGGRLAKMRKMIRLACMESVGFRTRKPAVDAVVAQIGALSTSLSNFGRTLPAESLLRGYIEPQITALHEAIGETIDALAGGPAGEAAPHIERSRACLQAYEERLLAFRIEKGAGEGLPIDESLEHAGYSLSVHEIFGALTELARLLPEVDDGQTESFPMIRLQKFTLPDLEWVKAGIRGGLAVALGLFLLDWLRPPGGDILVVGTYLFTAFSQENTDRKGDLGVFNVLLGSMLFYFAFFLFLLLAAPLMSSYAVLNIFLATFLFLTGYLLETGAISSFNSLQMMLVIVALVGLNAQNPVPFQAIVSPVIGLAMATVLSSLIRRLIWPALPQHWLRERIAELLGLLEKSSARPDLALPVPDRARVALASADALVLVGVVEGGVVPSDEAGRLRAYIRSLARLGGHLMSSTGQNKMPPAAEPVYSLERARLLSAISSQLGAQRIAIETGQPMPPASPPLPDVRAWTPQCRQLIRKEHLGVTENSACLGLLYRLEQSAIAATDAAEVATGLACATNFADHVL